MENHITVEQALRLAKITKNNLLELEKAWKARFYVDLPIPRNERGHRQMTPAWAYWLHQAWLMHKRGASLLEIKYELAQVQPRLPMPEIEPRRSEEPVYIEL